MPLPSNMVQAVYRESEIPSYRGNPLIEALPPTLNLKQLKIALMGDVHFDPRDIYADGRQRAHIISSLLDDFFQPLPAHIQLEEKLSILIRRGYVGRNLKDGSLNTHLQNGYERVMSGDLEAMRFRHAQSTALSLSLIGCSGSGKTTTLNRILSVYPQVIHHPEYNFTQITFLKVDCPHDGSLKSLCIQFFRALDRVLHSNYEAKYTRKRHSVETLLALMGQTANAFAVGVLIIDEIQHLSRKNSGGIDKMLNFFVTLVNVIGVPVVFVGTPKARPIFEADLRSGRRGAGFGALLWEPMKSGTMTPNMEGHQQRTEWEAFTDKLWRNQWLRNRDEILSKDVRDCWYDLTQGVLDIVVKLFVLSQLRAIVTGTERITSGLMRRVYDDELKPVHPMLAALRSGDPERIALYSDLTLPNVDRRMLELQTAIEGMNKGPSSEPDALSGNAQAQRLRNLLLAMDCTPDRVTPLVERAFREHLGLTVKDLVPVILEWYKQEDPVASRTARRPIPRKGWGSLPTDDLRHVLAHASTDGVYAHLKQGGIVFDMEAWTTGAA